MRIWTSTTSPNTTGVTHMPRRRQPIITGEARRRGNWTKSSGWRNNACSAEDWVVRYQNRLLQLERPRRPRIPAKRRGLVRENQAGEITIHYREPRLLFREVKAAPKALSEGIGAAPSLALPSPKP